VLGRGWLHEREQHPADPADEAALTDDDLSTVTTTVTRAEPVCDACGGVSTWTVEAPMTLQARCDACDVVAT